MKKFLFIIALILVGFLSGYLLLTFIILSGKTEVPDLKGKDIVQANQILREKGLHIRIDGHEYSDSPVGTIFKQEPPAGIRVKSGREIGVVISKGMRFAFLPDVTGIPYEEAERKLKEIGIPIEKVIYINSEVYPELTVIAQRPEPDEGGQSIKLLVSKKQKEEQN
ncbi:MAG: PASTA domain-containing protein [Thermodesulfovibrio sp.]|nr:PASTA domain-containing protein [Thermodesulfovibrio sp.]